MDRSPYLVQALQALGQAPAQSAYGAGSSLQDLAQAIGGSQQGQPTDPLAPVTVTPQAGAGLFSRVGHNLAAVPGNLAQAYHNVLGVPGQVGGQLKGLFGLGGR